MGDDFEPQFVGLVQNVTVVVGREAILSCSVTKLRDFKVGWIKADQTILTLHKRVITLSDTICTTHGTSISSKQVTFYILSFKYLSNFQTYIYQS